MSKDAKRQKDHRRREREFREKRASHAYLQPKPAPPPTLLFLSYDVTFDPIPDLSEPRLRLKRMMDKDAMYELNKQIKEDPTSAIPRLHTLVEAHPDVPMLYNWLTTAYTLSGDYAKADAVNTFNYERHPHYLFAVVYECHRHVREGNLDRAKQILDGKNDVKLMYPHRDLFHVAEVIGFHQMLVQYYLALDDVRSAEIALKALVRFDPDSEQTKTARKQIATAGLFSRVKSSEERATAPRRDMPARFAR
jgi:hypothetical protein